MFDWLTRKYNRPRYPTWDDVPPLTDIEKIGQDMSKVIPFPESNAAPPMPEVKLPKEPAGKTVYSIGLTDDNRVSIVMGYNSVTMNAAGVQQMIEQLELFKSQIEKNEV
jgi:hypothetical protein